MNIHKAIYKTHLNVKTINGSDQNDITAVDDKGNEVTINWSLVNSWNDPEQYKMDRVNEYPTIQDQLDMQYHDAINGTTTWQDAITKVKTDYPKDNS